MDKIRQQAREGLAAPGIADADVDHIDEDLVLEYLGGARGVDEAVLNEYGEPAEGAPGQQGAEQPPQYRVINAHSLARIGFWLYFKVVGGRGRCTNDAYRWNCPEPGPCRVEERADRCADGHRYYVVEAGTHVDSLYDEFPDRLRPILPCYRAALTAFERWVEDGESPGPASPSFAPKPAGGDVVNDCSLQALTFKRQAGRPYGPLERR